MHKVFTFFIPVGLFAVCFQAWSFPGMSTEDINAYQYPEEINWIEIEDLKNRFKDKAPMRIGFDLDDAIVFTSAIVEKNCPDCNAQKFESRGISMFEKLNCDEVRFTIPKRIGKALVAFHQARDDELYFITARKLTPCVNEGYSINDWIKETFDIKNMHPVIFTDCSFGKGSKTKWLKENKIAIFYGDSNSDIESAQEAGISGIRLMRASNSWEHKRSDIGKYGELVIQRSDI